MAKRHPRKCDDPGDADANSDARSEGRVDLRSRRGSSVHDSRSLRRRLVVRGVAVGGFQLPLTPLQGLLRVPRHEEVRFYRPVQQPVGLAGGVGQEEGKTHWMRRRTPLQTGRPRAPARDAFAG